MGEPQIITFSYKEIVTALIKHQGIHEGIWGLTMQVGLQAGPLKVGPSENDKVIGLIIPFQKIGIQKQDKPDPLAVDAAEVNPRTKP